jgi:hypothetical protein
MLITTKQFNGFCKIKKENLTPWILSLVKYYKVRDAGGTMGGDYKQDSQIL